MNFTIDKGYLRMNAFDLFEEVIHSCDEELRADFLDSISCIEVVVKNVADQIIDGWTELSSHAPVSYGEAVPSCALNEARRRIAVASSEIAAREIKELEAAILRKEARIRELEREASNVREWLGHGRYEQYAGAGK